MSNHSRDEDREIWVNEFNEKSAQKFRDQVLYHVERAGEDTIIPVYIDSYGGYVDSLAKMIETMDSVGNRFATVASGKAMSCGAILLSHGDLRWCGPLSRVMIHNISSASYGDTYDIKQHSEEMSRMQTMFMGLLAKNCGLTYPQLAEKIKETTSGKEIWMDAEAALKFGIVDRIGVPMFMPAVQFFASAAPEKPRLTDEEKGVERKKGKPAPKKKSKKKG